VSRSASVVVRPSLPPALWLCAGVWAGALAAEETSWRSFTGTAPPWLPWLALCAALAVAVVTFLRLPSAVRWLALGLAVGLLSSTAYWVWWRAAAAATARSGARDYRGTVIGDPETAMGAARVRVALDGGGTAEVTWTGAAPEAGQRVRFRSMLQPPGSGDPFGRMMEQRGDVGEGRAWATAVLGWQPWPFGALMSRRDGILEALARERGPGAALFSAVVLGDRRRVAGTPLEGDFRVAGLAHVLAASALYAGVLCLSVRRLARAFGLRPASQSLLAVCCGCAYAVSAGMTSSMLRGLAMFAFASIAGLASRRRDSLASVGLVVAGMLVVSPVAAFDLGLALGACVVCGLAVFGPLARSWTAALLPDALASAASPLSAAVVAQLSALPLAAGAFGMVSLVGPVSILATLPLLSVGLLVGVAAVGTDFLAPRPIPALIFAAETLFGAAARVAGVFAALPGAALPLSAMSAGAGVASAGAAVLLWARWPLPRRRRRLRRVAVALAAALLFPLHPPLSSPAEAKLVVMDVGQGDAILYRDGDAAMLVDCGPKTTVLRAALARQGVRHLDCVVLTHIHADHVGGMDGLTGVVTVGWVAGPTVAAPNDFAKQRALAARLSPPRSDRWRTLSAGDTWTIGRTRVRVLWPEGPDATLSPNDTSVILALQRGTFTAMLTGDAEARPQQRLVELGEVSHVDVLKEAHHGSVNGLFEASLAGWSPRVALISVGAHNDFGHPAARTLRALAAAGAEVHRTDLEGDLEVDVAASSWSLRHGGGLAACATISRAHARFAAAALPAPAPDLLERDGRLRPRRPQARLSDLRRRGAASRARGPPFARPAREGGGPRLQLRRVRGRLGGRR
jgi:competence protein ComEC